MPDLTVAPVRLPGDHHGDLAYELARSAARHWAGEWNVLASCLASVLTEIQQVEAQLAAGQVAPARVQLRELRLLLAPLVTSNAVRTGERDA